MDTMTAATPHRTYRPYTRTGVFRAKLSPAQTVLLAKAGSGGIIRAEDGVSWLTLQSMADKGVVEVCERVVRYGAHGPIDGKILAVRVR